MPVPLFEITGDSLNEIPTVSFESARIRERDDLQRLLRDKIDIIAPDTMVLAEEFCEWEGSSRRIDLLAIDKAANLVVIELKRTEDGGHMDLQAIRYAAMISTMKWTDAVKAHRDYLRKRMIEADAQDRLLSFLGWDSPREEQFAQDVRVILVSADFSKEITGTVLWLNDRKIDIRCVRLVPYQIDQRVLVDVQQVIPLPEAEEFQIRLREKAAQERASRQEQSGRAEIHMQFWEQFLEKAKSELPRFQKISPVRSNWIGSGSRGCNFNFVLAYENARVEFVIDQDKAFFDELLANKDPIERSFGVPLDWQRLDNRASSRICLTAKGGTVTNPESWGELHRHMIDSMKRLEDTLKPYLQNYWNK